MEGRGEAQNLYRKDTVLIMSRAIFDLEQQMLEFANVTTDIEMMNRHFTESPKWKGMDGELCDAILNKYGAIQELYEIKFQNMWDTFEIVCREYHGKDKE